VKQSALDIEGLLYFAPEKFVDERGFLYERYNSDLLLRLRFEFVQQNVSVSKKGVIRGMHWQYSSFAQGKFVTCLHGEIFDVAVDIRRTSPTFGRHISIKLSGSLGNSIWIPKGFAHGFQTLTESAVVTYSVDAPFAPNYASEFNPLDKEINIEWPFKDFILSVKDRDSRSLRELPNDLLFD